jgi:hypothetical protein
VLVVGARFAGPNMAEDDVLLKVIKIRGTTFFGEKVKPSVSCHKILRYYNVTYQDSIVTRQLNDASLLCSLIGATMKTSAS